MRRVRLVLLCEDGQQECFVRRFLKAQGWQTREMYVLKSPAARGAAEQWVRERYPLELAEYRVRSTRAATGLMVMIDADAHRVEERKTELDAACEVRGVSPRRSEESVALLVPRRNIETWIHFLDGEAVDEEREYPKLQRERESRPAVARLHGYCTGPGLPEGAPDSLRTAGLEYKTRIKPLSRPDR